MIFLALFSTLAVAYSAASNMSLRQARNYMSAQTAQFAAESGLNYMAEVLRGINVDAGEAEEDLLLAVANGLAERMDGTANMGEGEITFVGDTISTPPIALNSSGETFQADIREAGDGALLLEIRGNGQVAAKGVRIAIQPVEGYSPVFDYGVASKSRIKISGNPTIKGANDPSEASILSATYSDEEAVRINGNCWLDGDICTANPDSHVTILGNPEIAGKTDWDDIQEHIHIGVGPGEFPEIDPTVFEPFATNIVDKHTDTSSDMVLENIRIAAGTNPNFAGNCTIKGVVFVEQPNKVKFSGNCQLIGVIVTEDAGEDAYNSNYLRFNGNFWSEGVEALPDEPQFSDLKQMPGSAILAPGFGVRYQGNVESINGTIAADKLTFNGNVEGTIYGSLICYSDSAFEISGNVDVTIDREKYSRVAPGFKLPVQLVPEGESYEEF